ncbi:MAG: hypothetical protein ACOYNN_17065, partial [Terrimicrobiaceae bacterium]
MNGLSEVGIFPNSMNLLQQIYTSNGGALPVAGLDPVRVSLTSTTQDVFLYESSTDVINFKTFDKSLIVGNLTADTGTFHSFNSTGAVFQIIRANTGTFRHVQSTTINNTGTISSKQLDADTINANLSIYSNLSANFPNADVGVYGITANLNGIKSQGAFTGPSIFVASGTFKSIDTDNLIARNLILTGAYINNLRWDVATGAVSFLGRVNTTFANRCRFDTFQADTSIFTPQMQLDNTSIRVDALYDLELVANSPGRIFFRRGQSDVGNQITMEPEYGSLYAPTGYFTGLVGGACEFSNAKILSSLTGSQLYFNNGYFDNLYAKSFVG